MKSIKSKLMTIFILMFLSLFVVVVSSYVAIDTGKQHLILTELLSKQKLLIERVTFTALNSGEIALYNPERFMDVKDKNKESIESYVVAVDFMLNAFETRKYPIDGNDVKLKFNKSFSLIFDDALNKSKTTWISAKADVDWLFDEDNLKDSKIYEQKLSEFNLVNIELIKASDYITRICRDEANRKKQFSEFMQMISISLSALIFIFLIWIIKRDIESPIMIIRNEFKKMGKGDFNVKLLRDKDDEFKSLYDDFNGFIENFNIIKNIENHILEEDGLFNILSYMKTSFKDFIPLESISLYYMSTTKNTMLYTTENNESIKVESNKTYDEVTTDNDKQIIVPIIVNGKNVGYTEFKTITELTERNIAFITGLKEKIGFALYKSLLFKELLSIVTGALSELAEHRDPETKRHLVRMSYYSKIIAEELKLSPKYSGMIDERFIENLVLTSPMHDIGKVSVPDNILLKPGKLTDDEYIIMKTHAYHGAVVLKKIHESFTTFGLEYFKMAEHIANFHQEKFDGSGYPDKISGTDIPLAARISALADVFDALTSKRPYKEAFSLEKSYGIINESIGSHFDPDVVEAFFKAQSKIEDIYELNKEI